MPNKQIIDKIEKSLDKVRPMLQRDGGDIKLVDFDEKTGTVKVAMQGHCVGCAMAQQTLKQVIEAKLTEDVEEVKEVVI